MPVVTSAIPATIDALLKLIRGLSAITAPAGTNQPPIPVYDGLPGPEPGDVFVQVGGVDVIATDGGQGFLSIGAANGVMPARQESYAINVYISAFVGGDNAGATGTSDANKTARDKAFTIFNAIEVGLRNDPTLTTAMGGNGLATGWLGIGRVAYESTTGDVAESQLGRRAVIAFQIDVFKALYSQ